MRQRQIIKEIAETVNLKQSETKQVIDCLIQEIRDSLMQKKHIEIRGFGNFELVKHKERESYIPHKKAKVTIPAHYRIHFRAGKKLKEELSRLKK